MKMRAQHYEKEYRTTEKQLVRLRREAKATGNFFVEPEAKLIFCPQRAGRHQTVAQITTGGARNVLISLA